MKKAPFIRSHAATFILLLILGESGCQTARRQIASLDDVNRESPVVIESQKIVGLDYEIQNQLQFLNEKYDGLFTSPKEVQRQADFYIDPKTELEREKKIVFEETLTKIRALEARKAEAAASLNSLIQSDPVLWSEQFPKSRFLGTRISPYFTLFNGPSISRSNPDPANESVGSLGKGVRELCVYEKESLETGAGPIDLFLNLHVPAATCAYRPERVRLISDPQEGLNTKIRMLTGMELPSTVIENPSPDYKIDFSRAPELDAIVMSYLEFKNDFSGQMMAQIVRYHADRGVPVRILLPDLPIPGTSFIHGPDRKLLDSLESYSKNIVVHKYRYAEKNPDATTPLSYLQRSYHAKILAVLAKDPFKSGVILGGRNIKDTFYMKNRPDYSNWPEMIQYGSTGSPFGFFRDLEFYAEGREIAEQVASQVMAFWFRDEKGPKVRRMSAHVKLPELSPEKKASYVDAVRGSNMVRFFYSVPYVDNHSLEDIFVQLLDSAKKRIRIASAYVRPTKAIAKAIRNAARRGVEIDFLTSVDFSLDNSPSFTGDMNRSSFNSILAKNEKDLKANSKADAATPVVDAKENARVAAKIKLYFWDEKPSSILHTKAMLIDDEVLYIGSANMDVRTYRQDVENGALVTGEAAQEFRKLFDEFYIPTAQVVQGKQKTSFVNEIIIKLLDHLGVS